MNITPKKSSLQAEDKYIVRFPEGMRSRIAEQAKNNGRSMNAEIVARLEKSFMDEPLDPVSLSGIQKEILGLVEENVKMRTLLTEHLEFIGVLPDPDKKTN